MKVLEKVLQTYQPDEPNVLYVDAVGAGELSRKIAYTVRQLSKLPWASSVGLVASTQGQGPFLAASGLIAEGSDRTASSASPSDRLSPMLILYAFLPPSEGGREPVSKDPKKNDGPMREFRLKELQKSFGVPQLPLNGARLQLNDPNVFLPEAYTF